MNQVYNIDPPKTSKDEIKQPALADAGVIPKLNTSNIIVGKRSGKSVLLQNLITKPEFYGNNVFDKIFLISPTGKVMMYRRL